MAPGPPLPSPITAEARLAGAARCTFAVIVLCELVASPAAAVPLAAERPHCIDAGLAKPAVVAARDAFIDI